MPFPWIRYCRRRRSHVGFNPDVPNCIFDLFLFARILAIDPQRHECYYFGIAFCVTLANLGSPTLLKYSPTSQKQDMLCDIGRHCVVFPEYRKVLALAFLFASYSRFCCIPLVDTSPSVVEMISHVSRGVQYCSSCSVFLAMRRLLDVCWISQKQSDEGYWAQKEGGEAAFLSERTSVLWEPIAQPQQVIQYLNVTGERCYCIHFEIKLIGLRTLTQCFNELSILYFANLQHYCLAKSSSQELPTMLSILQCQILF